MLDGVNIRLSARIVGLLFISVNTTSMGSAGRCKATAVPAPGAGIGIRGRGRSVEAMVLLLWMESALLCLAEEPRTEGG